ncbi:Glycosyl transferase family 2 [Pseudobutyrivibrio sp. ACV-2]|uniref:glycosyltransferase n=1 Tax=Pseudobutyrivibrio sp. ACV-2 TaxID=1520801 RepID=UPI00089752CA|nr:glycosyltransferase [Pseudobutyrivibrio sp. ACV-2]SEA10743.1 Glycosyl transferase family 2 [Pseudobutyrivibrio sp. ACV-2]
MDKVSIIIPIYNAGKYLGQCINSIIAQDYPNKEIILINDGSTDDSEKLCREFKKEYPEVIKYEYQNNAGQIAARKRGLELASGKWCLFVDADDWLVQQNDVIQSLVNKARMNNVDVVLYDCKKVYRDKESVITNVARGTYSGIELACDFINDKCFYESKMITSLWGGMYKIESIREIIMSCPNDIRMSEDVACVWNIMANVDKVLSTGQIVYCYRIHEESFCRTHSKDLMESEKKFYEYLKAQFLKKEIWKKVENQIILQMVRDMMLADYNLLQAYYKDDIFPFNVKIEEKVAIYGCGDMGQEYLRVLSRHDRNNIVMVVDKEKTGEISGFKIDTPSELVRRQKEMDKILIMATRTKLRESIKNELISLGIDSNKIAKLDMKHTDIIRVLDLYNL